MLFAMVLIQSCEKDTVADLPNNDSVNEVAERGPNPRPPGSNSIVEVPDECFNFEEGEDCPSSCLLAYERCERRAQWRFIQTILRDESCDGWVANIQDYFQAPSYYVAVPVGGDNIQVQGGYHNFDPIQIYVNYGAGGPEDCPSVNFALGNFDGDCSACQDAYDACCD